MTSFPEFKQEPPDQQKTCVVRNHGVQKQNKDDTIINATKHYRKLVAYLARTFEEVRHANPVDIREARSTISEVINSPISRSQWFGVINQIRYSSSSESFLVFHHANVAILTVCLGITLKLNKEERHEAGTIALLHDIGKARIPDEILFKNDRLTESEREVMRRYPQESHQILRSPESESDLLAECALQVNETLDGMGYPQGLRGDAIHPYALMIGLVDVYEAMTSHRPYRRKLLHFDAIKEILKTKKSAYPRKYINAFLKTFSIFPLHSYVTLNSGLIGRIVEVREELPMRPKIEVICDEEKERLAVPLVVDLASQPFLYITASISEDQLPTADSRIRVLI